MEQKFTASLHTHVRSLYDADIPADMLIKKIKEYGGKGCAITDHGSLYAIEDYRRAFSDAGLTLIPGVELYIGGGSLSTVGRRHLILLAVDNIGYKGISKIVTESNRTMDGQYPVIDMPRLKKIAKNYKGHIICLSACMQGVICSVYLLNETIERKVDKILSRQQKYISPQSKDYIKAKEEVKKAEALVETLIEKRDDIKRTAEQKFSQWEKAIKSLPEETKAEALKSLSADKASAEKAKNMLPIVKNELTAAKRDLTIKRQALKTLQNSVDKYIDLENEIVTMKSTEKSEEEMDKAAMENAAYLINVFGKDNFYIELQYHGIREEAICFPKAAAIAKKMGIPVVATNDVHILIGSEDDRLKRQILRSLRFKTDFEEENIGDKELYLKTDDELKEALMQIFPNDEALVDEAIANIGVIYDRCKDISFPEEKHYPKFGGDANKILEDEIRKGVVIRFPNGMDDAHKARLNKELPVIEKMGYADYHLVVKDFLEYGRLLGHVPNNRIKDAPLTIDELKSFIKENGWENYPGLTIGPGRGSAVGSLVCYLLGITNLDPLKYDLLFERFLNVERVSMPDIDSDIANTTRSKVIEYVKHKYGENAVCGIMTVLTQAPKGAIAIASKFYGLKKCGESMRPLGDKIAKDVPAGPTVTFSSLVDTAGNLSDTGMPLIEYLKDKYKSNEDASEILHWASVIENSVTTIGAHAAGIVISDNNDVSDYLPLRMNTKFGGWTTQCNMVEVEENGLLKFDFLGLKTLDIITEAMRLIQENKGRTIDLLNIDLEDKKVYKEIFQQAKTGAVFQFSSNGMKQMLKKFRPEKFEDLIILNSMFRPGPEQYLDDVCDVKNGRKPVSFLCPELEHILGKTYGAIVYQEQVMQIFQDLAGYSLGGADMVRRYMSKKKAEKLAHEREAFINGDPERGIKGCVANGISAEVADKLFDQMSEFAKYAFNKSHAAAYSFNAYITAWLKTYYPAEFFAAALDWAADNDEISTLMQEASLCNVTVLRPDVNESEIKFSVENGKIRFALSSIQGIKSSADEIVKERRAKGGFNDIKDLLIRVPLNRTEIANLIKSGACDSFDEYPDKDKPANRKKLLMEASEIMDLVPDYRKKLSFIRTAEEMLPMIDTIQSDDELQKKQEEAGVKVEIKTLTSSDSLQKRRDNAQNARREIEEKINEAMHKKEVAEDKDEKLRCEKELLGAYVTAHPIDYYPSAKKEKCVQVGEITVNSEKAYGIITDLTIKKRKKDGMPMAFFNIEDRTGSIKACCFTKAYGEYGSLLKEGHAYIFTGNVNSEEMTIGTGENEHTDIELKFFVKTVVEVNENKPMIACKIPADRKEQMLKMHKNSYEDKDGEELCFIIDNHLDRTGLFVSRDLLQNDAYHEMYVEL